MTLGHSKLDCQELSNVDVRLFKNANFATANMMMLMVGAISLATTIRMPQFLEALMRNTAQSAGMVLSGAALLFLIRIPDIEAQKRSQQAIGRG